MTAWSDLPDEMRGLMLDEDTLDRLSAGRVDPDDAPPGYSEVARVLEAAATSIRDVKLLREVEDVAAARALVRHGAPAGEPSDGRSRQMKARIHRIKIAGLVVLGTLAGSTGLAVAGVHPDTAQDAFAGVLERVGISVPASEDHPASSGDEISEIATTTTSTGAAKGAEISSVASGGMSQASEYGSGAGGDPVVGSEGAPPVPVPNEGGTGTAGSASGGASDTGTDQAEEESEGRSEAGSGNATSGPPLPIAPAPSR